MDQLHILHKHCTWQRGRPMHNFFYQPTGFSSVKHKMLSQCWLISSPVAQLREPSKQDAGSMWWWPCRPNASSWTIKSWATRYRVMLILVSSSVMKRIPVCWELRVYKLQLLSLLKFLWSTRPGWANILWATGYQFMPNIRLSFVEHTSPLIAQLPYSSTSSDIS